MDSAKKIFYWKTPSIFKIPRLKLYIPNYMASINYNIMYLLEYNGHKRTVTNESAEDQKKYS